MDRVGGSETRPVCGEGQKGAARLDPYVPAQAGRTSGTEAGPSTHHGAASLLLAHGSR
jgi:hypothetical protein